MAKTEKLLEVYTDVGNSDLKHLQINYVQKADLMMESQKQQDFFNGGC